jgi:hypothetical protein
MKPVSNDNGAIINAALLTCDDVVHRKVLCPACGKFEFRMWPEGWDAHAVANCPGLEEELPEDRKTEYKATFRRLFR